MTPIIHLRSYSTDQYYLDKIFYSNFYRLKKRNLEEKSTCVIDIGAHCGYFSLTAMSAGYSKCYSLEPFSENYRVLLRNTEVFSDVIKCYQTALHPEGRTLTLSVPTLDENKFFDYGRLQFSENGETVLSSSFTNFFKDIVKEDIVDLVKISVGYDLDFLTNNEEAWSKVKNLCFELPFTDKEASFIKEQLNNLGFKESLLIELKEKDQKFGFLGFFSKDNLNEVFDIEDLKDKNYEIRN